MDSGRSPHVLDYYASHYRPWMIDLSASGPGAAGEQAEDRLHYGPPAGLPELREAVANLYPGLSPEAIVITNGASEALAAVAYATVRRGDPVSAPPGVYPSFREIAARLGAVLVDDMDAATGLVAVNNPSVPDGRLIDCQQLLRRVEACGGRVVADEVHLDLRAGTPARPVAALSSTAISIGDLSKPLGLGGLRIGWVACRDAGVIESVCRAVQLLSGGPSTVAMEMAIAYVRGYASRLEARCAEAGRNGRLVYGELAAAGWTFAPPEAGWTFVATPPQDLDEARVGALEAAGYFLVPASSFGEGRRGYRLSVFAPADALREALRIAGSAAKPAERSGEALVVLAKAPKAGFSKTRLAARYGDQTAADLSRAFLDDTLELAAGAKRPTVVAFTPAASAEDFARRAPEARLVLQPEGDLGARIEAALAAALTKHRAAALIGSDTPHLPPRVIAEAFRALMDVDVVIGPACDGGFYLLGLATDGVPPGLLDGIAWSTPSVCQRLMRNVRELGLTCRLLEEHADIDDAESLELALRWPQSGPSAPRTREVAGRLQTEPDDGA